MSIDSRRIAAVKKLERMGYRWSDATGDWEPTMSVERAPPGGAGVCIVIGTGGIGKAGHKGG